MYILVSKISRNAYVVQELINKGTNLFLAAWSIDESYKAGKVGLIYRVELFCHLQSHWLILYLAYIWVSF